MHARLGATSLLGLLAVTTGCTGWRVKDATPEETPDSPPRAERPIAARALADTEELSRRLEAAAAFEQVRGWHPGAGVAADEVDVLLGQRPGAETWAEHEHPFGVTCFVCSALLLPPFWFLGAIYMPWSPTSHLSHSLVATNLRGETLGSWDATPEIQLETQSDGWDGIVGGEWRHESRKLARDRATKMLADRLARDSAAAGKLGRAPCPEGLSGAALGRVLLDASGAIYVHPPEPREPTTTYEQDPQAHVNYWAEHARWKDLVPPPQQWILARLQYSLAGDNRTSSFVTRSEVVYTPVEGANGRLFRVASNSAPVAAFARARSQSPCYLLQRDTVGQKPVTWVLTTYWRHDARALELVAELYDADPATGAAPRDVVSLGPPLREGTTPPGYVRTELRLTAIHAVFKDGRPVKIEPDDSDPPLDAFLTLKETSIAEGRWRNHGLVSAKNKTLPRVLRDSKSSELVDLATRLEQLCLDLSHEKELAKDDAQRLVERNQATNAAGSTPDELRELSLVYQGRIEILKAILAAIKEEAGNRNR